MLNSAKSRLIRFDDNDMSELILIPMGYVLAVQVYDIVQSRCLTQGFVLYHVEPRLSQPVTVRPQTQYDGSIIPIHERDTIKHRTPVFTYDGKAPAALYDGAIVRTEGQVFSPGYFQFSRGERQCCAKLYSQLIPCTASDRDLDIRRNYCVSKC